MIRRAILLSLVVIAGNLSGCAYHMQQCGPTGCGAVGGAGACHSCGEVGCGGACMSGPLQMARQMATCGAGCGNLYINEWINDPPDRCDPCDDCGNWGPRGCKSRVWGRQGFTSLWGYRADMGGGGACGGGCTEHAHAHGEYDMAMQDGQVIYDGPVRDSGGSMQNQEEELRPPVPEPAEPRETRSVKKPWRQSAAPAPAEYYSRQRR
ncbi:MAG: hypothetical protein RIC55_30965 [Pirellulaceae bacterium]